MSIEAYLIVVVLVAVGAYFAIRWLVGTRSRFSGPNTITCPETRKPAVVEVDAWHASLTSAVGFPDIRLEHCSRWPLKEQCGQECLTSLDVAPEQCLVSGVLMRWYRGKNCCYCGKPFEELHWTDHRPALRTPEGLLLEWSRVPIEDISMVMETHLPVCWDCYIAQSFRRDHPDLVVYRPWRNDIAGGADSSSASRHL
jgi:hypothetical protein